MSEDGTHRHIEVSDGDRRVGSAEVTTSAESQGTVRAAIHKESGHVPPGSRSRLVDAVLDLPEVQDSTRLEATLPLGDSESLHRLQERCDDVATHAAGSSALIDADLTADDLAGEGDSELRAPGEGDIEPRHR